MATKRRLDRAKWTYASRESQDIEMLLDLRTLSNLPPKLIPSETNHPPLMHRGYPIHEDMILEYATENDLVDRDDNREIEWLETWGNVWKKLDSDFNVGAELIQVWEVYGGAL
ncbi:hypothetical protein JAAARDRAFT_188075 [Jaapia argillacea MUCL 33604]|uniref:Uncharacterized protein n=1 Tax=Jaapia argillacea MUCL 33604 TaxID=933084 RepID=A0A067QCS6_9AGAM|nr:hypothetical protein JAAARDRAFT_188075 [Jaapia argillacea MUCL 33604]